MGIKVEVGGKIVATNTQYSIGVPNGTVMTVTSFLPSGAVMANNDRHGLNWTMLAGTFEPFTQPPTTPAIWADMTDVEKGALLLAKHEGKEIEFMSATRNKWIVDRCFNPRFAQHVAYRIKPEPKRETVTLDLCGKDGWSACEFATGEHQGWHCITFDTIDGKPDPDSIKMERLT